MWEAEHGSAHLESQDWEEEEGRPWELLTGELRSVRGKFQAARWMAPEEQQLSFSGPHTRHRGLGEGTGLPSFELKFQLANRWVGADICFRGAC